MCEGHKLSIAEGVVTLLGEGDPSFFERAEEVEEFKVRSARPHATVCVFSRLSAGLSPDEACFTVAAEHECMPFARLSLRSSQQDSGYMLVTGDYGGQSWVRAWRRCRGISLQVWCLRGQGEAPGGYALMGQVDQVAGAAGRRRGCGRWLQRGRAAC